MEHAQRAFNKNMQCRGFQYEGLNPYFNGTCSKSEYSGYRKGMRTPECLNPYFNGTCSKRDCSSPMVPRQVQCLNPYFNGTCSKSWLRSFHLFIRM